MKRFRTPFGKGEFSSYRGAFGKKRQDPFRNFPRGLTFFKDFRHNSAFPSLNADFAKGSVTATFTQDGGNGSYISPLDFTGRILAEGTGSNTPRFNGGYYDTTGFHSARGLLLEGAVTNRATYSGTPENAAWTKTNITADNDDAGSSSPDGTATSNRLLATANNGTFVQAYPITGAAAAYTASVWMKRKTGTGTVYLGAVEDGTGKAECTLTTAWQRFTVSATTDGDDAGKDPAVYIELATDTDAVYIYGMQLEAGLYASSYVPNATAAVTRAIEALSYPTASNFPALTGNNCLSFDGANASGDDYVSVANGATTNQGSGLTAFSGDAWILYRSDGENDGGRILDKVTGNSGYLMFINSSSQLAVTIGNGTSLVGVTQSGSTTSANAWHHVAFSWTANQQVKLYVDGVATELAAGAAPDVIGDESAQSLYIGNRQANDRTFDGIIATVRIYQGKALSPAEVSTLYALGKGVAVGSAVTGCTQEFLFTDGTGTTLTATVGGVNGSISGATWTKDTHEGTVVVKYRPNMLANEQAGTAYNNIFDMSVDANNVIGINYSSNAGNKIYVNTKSNNNSLLASSANDYCSSWTRNGSRCLVLTFSTTADANSKKICLYDSSSTVQASNAAYVPPAGALPATFTICQSAGMSQVIEAVAIFNRCLSASEVAQVVEALK